MEKYQGGQFDNWDDVQREYSMSVPEPEGLIVAHYEYECYEGDSYVVWRDGDKVFEVSGGHCSCYGLEGQWEPEESSFEIYIEMLKRIDTSGYLYGFVGNNRDALLKAVGASA